MLAFRPLSATAELQHKIQQNAAATATSISLHLCTLAKESFVQLGVVVKFAHLQEQKSKGRWLF
jgi:hypothetical protein